MRLVFFKCLLIFYIFNNVVQAENYILVNSEYLISTGDYGLGTDTIIESIPLNFTYTKGVWGVQLGIAYLRIDGDGSVIPGAGGIVIGKDNSAVNVNEIASGVVPSAAADNASINDNNRDSSSNINSGIKNTIESGMGDTNIGLSYALKNKPLGDVLLSLSTQIKLATADTKKNLGTGENDYFFYLNGSYESQYILSYFTLGYVITGDTKLINYNDVMSTSFGFMLPLGQTFSAQVIFDYRGASVDYSDSFQQLNLYLDWKLTADWSLTMSVLAGLTDAAPDSGLSLGVARYF